MSGATASHLVVVSRSANLGHAYDLALAGALGAVFGLYLYVELVHASELWVRDALAGVAIGGTIGFFLNAAGPFRDGAWLKLGRAATWGTLAGAAGGSRAWSSASSSSAGSRAGWSAAPAPGPCSGLGIGVSQGLAGSLAPAPGLRRDRRRARRAGRRLPVRVAPPGAGPELRSEPAQGLGIVILGAGLGLFLALVEQVLRRAWVQVLRGRQEGRAYLLGAQDLGAGARRTRRGRAFSATRPSPAATPRSSRPRKATSSRASHRAGGPRSMVSSSATPRHSTMAIGSSWGRRCWCSGNGEAYDVRRRNGRGRQRDEVTMRQSRRLVSGNCSRPRVRAHLRPGPGRDRAG